MFIRAKSWYASIAWVVKIYRSLDRSLSFSITDIYSNFSIFINSFVYFAIFKKSPLLYIYFLIFVPRNYAYKSQNFMSTSEIHYRTKFLYTCIIIKIGGLTISNWDIESIKKPLYIEFSIIHLFWITLLY